MKPLRAWAVVHSGDQIDCWNWQIPVYWFKYQAIRERKKHTFSDSRVVRVEIREIRPTSTAGQKRG